MKLSAQSVSKRVRALVGPGKARAAAAPGGEEVFVTCDPAVTRQVRRALRPHFDVRLVPGAPVRGRDGTRPDYRRTYEERRPDTLRLRALPESTP